MVSKLAGRFRLIRNDDKELVVLVFGNVEKNQNNVDYICSFYHTPRTDRWLTEDLKDGSGFYLIVKKGD